MRSKYSDSIIAGVESKCLRRTKGLKFFENMAPPPCDLACPVTWRILRLVAAQRGTSAQGSLRVYVANTFYVFEPELLAEPIGDCQKPNAVLCF